MSVVEFIFRKTEEFFNFTKDRRRLLVPLGIWKILTIYFLYTCNQLLHHVMPRSFLLDTRVFSLYLYRWQLLCVCLIIFLQDHLLFPIFRANTNYIFFYWGCMIYSCLLYSRISVGEVSCLPASSIQQIIQQRSCSFPYGKIFYDLSKFF